MLELSMSMPGPILSLSITAMLEHSSGRSESYWGLGTRFQDQHGFELVFQLLFLQGVAHCEAIVLQSILCLNLRLVLLIFLAELLCFLDHPVNLCLRQTALLVGNGDLIRLARGLVLRRHIENAIRIDIKRYRVTS